MSAVERIISVTFLISLLVVLMANPWAEGNSVAAQELSEVQALLSDYSKYLSSGTTDQDFYYTNEMRELVLDRRAFYKELFDVGLVADLNSIQSEFHFDISEEQSDAGSLQVKATELVTLFGNNRLASPEDYPPVQAARWALLQRPDDSTQRLVQEYLRTMTDAVQDAIDNGFDITIVLQHVIVVRRGDRTLQLVKDSFSDKNPIDNPTGLDVVTWQDGYFARVRPELAQMPEAKIYGMPVKQLGESLLHSYHQITAKSIHDSAVTFGSYNRTAAKNYINAYTSNTTNFCPGSTETRQDESKYNNSVYTHFDCNDCANYVSQALHAGGIPTDGTWYPYNTPWTWVSTLTSYLQTHYYAEGTFFLSDLTIGDIATTSTQSHVVMVGGVSPYRFSAHTSDRNLYSWSSVLNRYYIITY